MRKVSSSPYFFPINFMSDTAVLEPAVKNEAAHEQTDSNNMVFESKKPGAWAKVYQTTSKEGKPAVYAMYDTYRKVDGDYVHNSFLNSFSDCENLVHVVNEALDFMRDFYKNRDA